MKWVAMYLCDLALSIAAGWALVVWWVDLATWPQEQRYTAAVVTAIAFLLLRHVRADR